MGLRSRFVALVSVSFVVAEGLKATPAWPVLVEATHHKAGSHLLAELSGLPRSLKVIGMPLQVDDRRGHRWHDPVSSFPVSRLRQYWAFDAESYTALVSGTQPFKLVHLIRDPLEMVISAYWYHLRHNDTQVVLGTGPSELQSLDTLAGLEKEAAAEFKYSLAHMLASTQVMSADPRVRTIAFEDFDDDFNGTVSCLYRFLLRPDHPELGKLLEEAQVANRRTWTRNTGKTLNLLTDMAAVSVTRASDRVRALQLISNSSNPVWNQVHAMRALLGYVEIKPGVFRRRSACNSSAQLAM